MPRIVTATALSLNELERLVKTRRRALARLVRQRDAIEKQVRALDDRIAELGGPESHAGRNSHTRRRPRNGVSLPEAIYAVLSKSEKPLSVGEIADGVSRAGYRSGSANFKGIVNQTLVKDKRFARAGRGLYRLK
jgi:hypothetical protein